MEDYYTSQAGSGYPSVYAGARYQKGNGRFGEYLKGTIYPLLKDALPYLGNKLYETGKNIYNDVKEGKDIESSVVRRLAGTAFDMGSDGISTLRKMTGYGRKRRRTKSRTKRSAPKRRKRQVIKAPRMVKRRKSRKTKRIKSNLIF